MTIDWHAALRLHRKGWKRAAIARVLGSTVNTLGRGLSARGAGAKRNWRLTRRRHGLKLYGLWRYLRRRCEVPTHPHYRDWGAKGIRLARAWEEFDAFYRWAMAAGYAPSLHLARIQRSRNFTPANCRWVDAETLRSRRPRPARFSFLVRAFGESKGQVAWARDPRCRVKQPALRDRLAAGWPPAEAIAGPPGWKPSRLVRPPKKLLRPRRRRARIDWDEARRLYREEGLSLLQIARRFGATRGAVVHGFRRLGVRLRAHAASTLDPEWRRLYRLWQSLHTPRARRRGARRFPVAPEWRELDPFLAWARSSGARKGLWLARKNPRWGWSPGNCEWVSRAEATRRRLAWT